MVDQDAGVIEELAAVIRAVDGSHELGAAALAEALVNRGVTIKAQAERRAYAVAARHRDGNTRALSQSFATLGEAAHELAWMRGDDYYRHRHPFVATCVEAPWVPVDEDVLVAAGLRAPAVATVNPAAIGDPEVAPILRIDPSVAGLFRQGSDSELVAPGNRGEIRDE